MPYIVKWPPSPASPAGPHVAATPVSPVTAGDRVPESAVDDPELNRRVVAFLAQLDTWVQDVRPGVPVLTLPGVTAREGACVSCGTAMESGRRWRCDLCLRAVSRALGMPAHGQAGEISLAPREGEE
jgi:hypothetical protein